MKYAIVKISGTQQRIAEGEVLTVSQLEGQKGRKLVLDEVLLVADGDKIKIGEPLVKGARVEAEIVAQVKGKKMRVATYKAKARYRRVKGFRPHLTRVKILSIIY